MQNYYCQLAGRWVDLAGGGGLNVLGESIVPAAQYHRRHTIAITGSACQWRYGVRGMAEAGNATNPVEPGKWGAVGQAPRGKWDDAQDSVDGSMSGSSLDWFFPTETSHDGTDMFAGGETIWEVPATSSKYPFYDSYEEFVSEDLRLKAKDCTIVPEFRISEHIDYYMTKRGGDFLAANTGSFTLTGSNYDNSGEEDFYKVYSHTDFMKKFDIVDKDHERLGGARKIELQCKAYLKLLPYNGFYPAQRTLQLASLFSQSYGPSAYQMQNLSRFNPFVDEHPATSQAWKSPWKNGVQYTAGREDEARKHAAMWAVLQRPFFAPGIMFNSIKSGLAVDYPIMTGSFQVTQDPFVVRPRTDLTPKGGSTAAPNAVGAVPKAVHATASGWFITEPRFHHRIPFEAIINPGRYVLDLPIVNMETHPSGSRALWIESAHRDLNITGAIASTHHDLYRMAANNFFAEVPEFFLEDGNLSSLTSLPENHPDFGNVSRTDILIGRKFGALVKLRKSVHAHQNFNRLSSSRGTHNPRDVGDPAVPTRDLNFSYRNGQMNVERLGTDYPCPHPWSLSEPTINMYSRPSAFGPPSMGFWGSNAGFNMPYTPPYYDGAAWAYLEFTPPQGAKKYTLDEILENTEITYTRAGKQYVRRDPSRNLATTAKDDWQRGGKSATGGIVPNWPWSRGIDSAATNLETVGKELKTGDDMVLAKVNQFFDPYPQGRDLIDDNAMQISASLNIMQKASLRTVQYNALTGRPITLGESPMPESLKHSWVIQTKFETPILNFQKSSSVGYAHGKETSAYGMWHQYGEYPEKDNVGIFMEITDVPKTFLYRGLGKTSHERDTMGSLADLVGFSTKPVKLGRPAQTKRISEAVVAVPFIEKDGERHFFEINRVSIDEAVNRAAGDLSNVRAFESAATGLKNFNPGESIVDMVEKMQKFVFPPKMDFLTYDTIQPFAMYIFEFSTDLDREDLTDIWQNVAPKIGRNFEEQVAVVGHELKPTELMGCDSLVTGKKLQNKLQWMVFKVKQKAQKNYFDKVVGRNSIGTSDNRGLLSNFVIAKQGTTSKLIPLKHTYNWPYDYFSLVELVKIDSTVEYGQDPFEKIQEVQ